MNAELGRAHATLCRGADFLPSWLRGLPEPRPGHARRSRVIGNGLRELDRFLSVLLDAASAKRGLAADTAQHNTANKLNDLGPGLGLVRGDDTRLRALGRSRSCLFYCEGIVRRGDTRQAPTMTAGWPAGGTNALLVVPIGDQLDVLAADLDSVSSFYLRLADDILDGLAQA